MTNDHTKKKPLKREGRPVLKIVDGVEGGGIKRQERVAKGEGGMEQGRGGKTFLQERERYGVAL